MKIFFLVLGTRGDLEVFLKLARALQNRGHTVIFGTSVFYQTRVETAGLQWVAIGHASHAELINLLQSLGEVKEKLQRTKLYGERWLKSELAQAQETIATIGAEADYFISNMFISLQRPDGIVPGAAVSYDPPASLASLKRYQYQHDRMINLVAMNQQLLDPQRQWGEGFHFTGFWLDEPLKHWDAPPTLRTFLTSGDPPIVFTLGSMVMFDPQPFIQIVLQALVQAKQRAIMIGGWSNLAQQVPKSDQIYYKPEIPYDWLFPQVACVVHHGGVGTIAEILRAGKPSILLPQVQSQVHFAEILRRENLATASFEIETLQPHQLAQAIQKAVYDPNTRYSPKRWQTIIQSDTGVKTAVHLIENHWLTLATHRSPRKPKSSHP